MGIDFDENNAILELLKLQETYMSLMVEDLSILDDLEYEWPAL